MLQMQDPQSPDRGGGGSEEAEHCLDRKGGKGKKEIETFDSTPFILLSEADVYCTFFF